ncbi:hypothetical protein [Halomicronema hongdechloris]|uniref:hypothetical protein n=1 Tax=Halomicronema hongdechloris TaxID=1209493 RepID=UPI001CECE43F|nr:hypothetical protein [Halomicronema hongdechloris]
MGWSQPVLGLPPADETPEEVLRTEIIVEARSPLDGEPLSPSEYAELQAQLQDPNRERTLSSEVRYVIFLLQLRRVIKPVVPFLP